MPRTKCRHCERLFTLRVGAVAARAVCPFCKNGAAAPKPAAAPWFLARGQEQQGPFTWEELLDLAARGEIGVADMLVQEGQAQWTLASTYLDLSAGAAPEAAAGDDSADVAEPELTAIQARLRALSAQFDKETYPAAKEPAPRAAQKARQAPAPAPAFALTEEEKALLAPRPVLDLTADLNSPRSAAPAFSAQEFLDSLLGEYAVPPPAPAKREPAQKREAPAAEPPSSFWHSASKLSTVATLLFALCGIIVCVKNYREEHAKVKQTVARPGEEPQEANPDDPWSKGKGEERERNATRISEFVTGLNRYRQNAGVPEVSLSADLCRGCADHARYLARHVAPTDAAPARVYRQDPTNPDFTVAGQKTAGVALVCYAEPKLALDRWMGRLFSRVQLLDPDLEQVGISLDQNAGGAWVSVADPVHGRGEELAANRAILYPAPNQKDVPCVGFDRLDENKGAPVGFPVSAMFPRQTALRNVRATLADESGAAIDVRVSSPDQPLSIKLQGKTVGMHPLQPLEPGRTYTVVLIATVNGADWRQSWQFTTALPSQADVNAK